MHAIDVTLGFLLVAVTVGVAGWRRAEASRAQKERRRTGVEVAPPTVAEACGQFATALCGRLGGCAPYALQLLYGDMTTCMSRVTLGCTRDLEVTDSNRRPPTWRPAHTTRERELR